MNWGQSGEDTAKCCPANKKDLVCKSPNSSSGVVSVTRPISRTPSPWQVLLFTYSLSYLFSKYPLSVFYISRTVLGTESTSRVLGSPCLQSPRNCGWQCTGPLSGGSLGSSHKSSIIHDCSQSDLGLSLSQNRDSPVQDGPSARTLQQYTAAEAVRRGHYF